MSKNHPGHEARRAFRRESSGDNAAHGHNEHADAGDTLHAAAYPQFSRTTHEQPKAGSDHNSNNNSADRPGQRITPVDMRPAAASDQVAAPASRDVTRIADRPTVIVTPVLDPGQPVARHLETGAFKKVSISAGQPMPEQPTAAGDASRVPGDRVQEGESRRDPIEKLTVVYSDQSSDPARRTNTPDFIVKKDGSIEVVSDPDKHNRKEVIIQLERDQGEVTGPTDAQRRSTDQLATYLSERLMRTNADGTKSGIIEDQQGLVSESLKSRLRTQATPEERLPVPVRHQVENMQRFSGGGRGTMSPQQADSYFTPRDQAPPRRRDEPKQEYSLKETVAAMLSFGDTQPYETVRHTGDRGLAVGRYQLTYDLFMQWLTDVMGDPPDPARLDELVRKGKISPQMAAKLKSPQFRQFLEKLKNCQQPASDEIKDLMPRELQERIGGDLINKFAQQCRDSQGQVDAGKVALAMATGWVPTDADLTKPENRAVVEAGRRLNDISDARTENPGQPLEWQEVNQRLLIAAKQSVGKAMWNTPRYNPATLEYGNLGCAASVSEVMRVAGVDGNMTSAGSILLEEKIIKAGGYRVSNPQPGDIVFGRRPPGQHSKGHVGIVGEDGKVYHNSSARKQWVAADLATVFNHKRGFIDIHYVRLPQNA